MEKVKKLAKHYHATVVSLRRHFHQFPELSGQEYQTAEKICEVLDCLQIPYQRGIAGNGVVALLQGKLSGTRCVALRADMDALPIQEENETAYASQIPQVMHACGHDAHIASLLGTLMILNDLKEQFGGSVKAIFQPSEEQYPGGAITMIHENVLAQPTVDCIFAQHATPGIEVGQIGLRKGAFMASTDEILIAIHGKGGHAALPEEYINPVDVGLELLTQMKQRIDEQKPKNIPTVFAFGQFIANGLTNLIADTATIAGTLRTFDETWRTQAHTYLHQIVQEVSAKTGAKCQLDIRKGYPVLINDANATDRVYQYACDYLGKENVIWLPLRTTAEDFAYFLQQKEGVFYRLGTSNQQKGKNAKLHTAQFDIDEDALLVGMGLKCWITLNELRK